MDVLSDAVAAMRTGAPHSSRTELRAPWGIRFAPQQGAGFHVVLRGVCWLLPVRGEPIELRPGDVAFLPRELGHAIADSPVTPLADAGTPAATGRQDPSAPATLMLCGAYRLDQSRAHPLLAELPDVVHLPAGDGPHPSLRGAVDLLRHELAAEPLPGTPGVLPALVDVLLLYMLRAWYDREDRTGWGAALRDPAVAAALRAVHRDPGHPWTVRGLAEEAGLSRSAFAQRFAAAVGSPPLAFVTWWRMTAAARLLRESDLLLRTVGERAGYTSEYAFAKAFRREFGTAPGRYRAAHRGQGGVPAERYGALSA
ncbi:AraC family transcriptional regulator [Streptomyces avicenniae]|uniref:AraC family transcriptional regulator n=1 Tax=Streptomyces avicenniae TaxID=500153 RepID=UPI0006996DE8|nr:AraC family transcriptional regulator [Streptomyces avicenniae]